MKFRDVLQEIKDKYPNTKEISVTYGGSGDSFDGFYNVDVDSESTDEIKESFITEYQPLLDAAVETTGDSFNNDGSQGTIKIDLVEMKVVADHWYNVMETVKDNDYELDIDEES